MTRDAKILRELYAVGDTGISGAALANRLGVSRAAIWARIEELRRAGFDIEASPHAGYRLMATPDRLIGDDLIARLAPTKRIGRSIQVFQETSSTNESVERLGRDGCEEGAIVIAESQTAGRGRLGRRWEASSGKGILMSILLRPPMKPTEVTRLTVIGALAVVRALRRCVGLEAAIKWPNDVVIGHRKLAGILTEMNAEPDRVRYLVLGMGVNVNQSRDDWPDELSSIATSVHLEQGVLIDRSALATAIIEELDHDYNRVLEGDFRSVASEWETRCSTLGKEVSVQFGKDCISGVAESIDDEGALLLRTSSGQLTRITGGDVSLVRR